MTYYKLIRTLFDFFEKEKFEFIDTQDNETALVTSGDPQTFSFYSFAGTKHPLPHTKQIVLDTELLENPHKKGVFCFFTSYMNESKPAKKQNATMQSIIEFVGQGNIRDLMALEENLLATLNFQENAFKYFSYDVLTNKYHIRELSAKHKELICEQYGDVVFIDTFPFYTHPFWDIKQTMTHAQKVNIIIKGTEIIESAEKSCHPEQMQASFYALLDGKYAKRLFKIF